MNSSERTDEITPSDISEAVTRSPFEYEDGSTQVFTTDGKTIYNDRGRPTFGTWGITGDGKFWSFWPPDYRAEYRVTWIGLPGQGARGVRFEDVNGGYVSNGKYSAAPRSSIDD